jgi:hypothetical protein
MDPMNTKQQKQKQKRVRIDKMMRDYIEMLERDGGYQTTHLEMHRDGRRLLDHRYTNTKAMRRATSGGR